MISKNKQKYLSLLQQKKNREEYQTFLVEGAKSVTELINAEYEIEIMFGTEDFYEANKNTIDSKKIFFELAATEELDKSGTLRTNNAAIAVAKMKPNDVILAQENEWVLVLDEINDPGNLGTIIRISDWYGIKKIVCSENTVDFYNPKTIAASMGSFTRVQLYRTNIENYLQSEKEKNILGAFLEGENVQKIELKSGGYLVLGSESHGISTNIEKLISKKITIPKFGNAESLNVGIATAVILDNLLRIK